MEKKSYREGFEAALGLCIKEMEKSGSKEAALARLSELMTDVKNKRVDRLKELLAGSET